MHQSHTFPLLLVLAITACLTIACSSSTDEQQAYRGVQAAGLGGDESGCKRVQARLHGQQNLAEACRVHVLFYGEDRQRRDMYAIVPRNEYNRFTLVMGSGGIIDVVFEAKPESTSAGSGYPVIEYCYHPSTWALASPNMIPGERETWCKTEK